MKVNALLAAILAVGLVGTVDTSYAAFGGARASGSGIGVSRSYSRPSSPPSSSYSRPASTPSSSSSSSSSSYSRPATSYSAPPASQPSTSYSRPSSSYSQPAYNNSNSYNSNNYQQPQRNSAMRDIGVTAAGVGAGILGAQAITHLLSSPSHPGYYTHPQYPGQYFNSQGVPMGPPQESAYRDTQYNSGNVSQQPIYPQQQQQSYPVQQANQESSGTGFFGFLWGLLGNVLHLALYLAVIGGLAYGGYKLSKILKRKYKEELENKNFDIQDEFTNFQNNTQEIFYDFQKNSNNLEWLTARTKYMPLDEAMDSPSKVLQFGMVGHEVFKEQGKLRATVRYIAVLKSERGEEQIDQWWDFEKDTGIWKVTGIVPA